MNEPPNRANDGVWAAPPEFHKGLIMKVLLSGDEAVAVAAFDCGVALGTG